MKKGKAYAHKSGKREGDGYPTPKSLVWAAEEIIKQEFEGAAIYEPAAGDGSISEELSEMGFPVYENDLYMRRKGIQNCDYLKMKEMVNADDYQVYNYVITNPPFSLWDEFVLKAKTHCKKFMFIGRTNYFGSAGRMISGTSCERCPFYAGDNICGNTGGVITKAKCTNKYGNPDFMLDSVIWKNLKYILPFSRYVDYQTPYRTDGLFCVGSLQTAWFIWDMEYISHSKTEVLDVNKYAKLGSFRKGNDNVIEEENTPAVLHE